MLKIRKTIILLAVVCGLLLAVGNLPAHAAGKFGDEDILPPGSYQTRCRAIVSHLYSFLQGLCVLKDGTYKNLYLRYYYLCDGDIFVDDKLSRLNCKRNSNSPQFKEAAESFAAASILIFGKSFNRTDAFMNPEPHYPDIPDVLDSDALKWLAFYIFDKGRKQQYLDGIDLTQAVDNMKDVLLKGYGNEQQDTIDRAYKKVFNREPTSAEFLKWQKLIQEQKAWYATIVNDLKTGK